MVSSIVPGATSAGALAVDQRLARSPAQGGATRDNSSAGQDRVELSGPAALATSRESVATGLVQVQQALSVARDAQTMLLKLQTIAADPNANQADLGAALQDYASRYSAAAQSNVLIKGQAVSVNAEPGSAPSTIFSATVIVSTNIKCWCTIPMPCAIASCGVRILTVCPLTRISPLSAV